MPNSSRPKLVRITLIFGALTVLLHTHEIFAQIQNSPVSQQQSSASGVQVVADSTDAVTPQTDPFTELLDRAIEITSKRTLTANAHSPWQIFHNILALRQDTVLRLGDQKVNAIEWLATTEPQFDKQPWLLLTKHGAKFHSYTRIYAFEGHPSQFLALLSHSNLPMDYQFHVQGKVVTLNDLVNNSMKEVNTAEEVTWVLWALQHFLKPDAVWVNQLNETWSIERLVQMETSAPVVGAPCGGNHRLFALTRARDKYLASGGQLRGVWYLADQKIKQHIEIARSLQNPDGSFSNEFYKGPGHTTDVNKRFNTSGHTMEFLSASLPKERLSETWVRNAVWMLSRELIINRDTKIDCGPLFHSLNALILYRDRIRQKTPTTDDVLPPASLAQQKPAENPVLAEKMEVNPKEIPRPIPVAPSIAQKPVEEKPAAPELRAVPIPIQESKPIPAPKPIAVPNPGPVTIPAPVTISLPVPNPAPVSLPIPDPIVIPESKPDQPVLEPPALPTPMPVPQAFIPKTRISKAEPTSTKQASAPKPALPKIDPTKLANIGQLAPSAIRSETPVKIARRDTTSGAPPELLPDLSATPLASPDAPIPIPDPEPLSLPVPAKTRADENKIETPTRKSTPLPKVLSDAEAENDQPVSALDHVNR
ncbi:MAG: hypothetical protein WCH39_00130 [Schlesneria sp.]